jgi:hypothetical protein
MLLIFTFSNIECVVWLMLFLIDYKGLNGLSIKLLSSLFLLVVPIDVMGTHGEVIEIGCVFS